MISNATCILNEKIFLGNFGLSQLERPSEHYIFTNFLYHRRSGSKAWSKIEFMGVGVPKAKWWLVSQNFVCCSSGTYLECIPQVGSWLFHKFAKKCETGHSLLTELLVDIYSVHVEMQYYGNSMAGTIVCSIC